MRLYKQAMVHNVVRLEFQSMADIMHLYQAAMAGKFEGRDKSLLLSDPLNRSLQLLVDNLISDARKSQPEDRVNAMLDGLKLSKDYPQYEAIISAFTDHHDELNWLDLSPETQHVYITTAAIPLTVDSHDVVKMREAITQAIQT